MDEAATHTLGQKLAAEGLGTFVLVFFGCGTALASGGDYVATALAFGLTVLTMAYAVGHVSGGHFNPAVSVGAALSGRISWRDTGLYSAVQVGSGIVAALVLLLVGQLYDLDEILAGVSNQWDRGGDTDFLGGFLVEMIGTAVFVLIILATTDKRRDGTGVPAPIAIGLALTLVHFALIGFTGTSVNPARSIGPGLFAGWDVLQQQWVFILAPLAGAAVAGFGYPAIFGWDRELPVRAPRPVATGAPQWDAQQQKWVGGTQEHGWQQPQQQWAQPDPNSQQQWQQPQQPSQPQQPQQPSQPQQQRPWQQPDPNAPRQPWEAEGEDGRTQIRPPEGPA